MRMKKNWAFILIVVGGLLLFWVGGVAAHPATARSGSESSCKTCHETDGKNPIGEQGDWHIQHAMNDLCSVCHGGDASAAEQAQAHAGVIKNPLSQPEQRCALCHPDDFSDRAAQYALLITPEAEPSPTSPPTLPPTAPPTVDASAPGAVATEAIDQTEPTEAPLPTSDPTQTPAAAVGAAAPGGTAVTPELGGWMAVLLFTRGPLFKVAFWVFALGMLYRLIQVLRMGWRHSASPHKANRAAGITLSFVKGLLVLPFIPWVKGVFRQNRTTYIAGGFFHLGLLVVILFSKTHMLAWKTVLGFGWPVVPKPVIDILAAIALVAMMALLVNRIVNPVLRLISGPAEWLNWLFVFLPMVSGFILARKVGFPYEMTFSLHMILVDFLLVWIPLSRISHFMFYFIARAIHGSEFAPAPR